MVTEYSQARVKILRDGFVQTFVNTGTLSSGVTVINFLFFPITPKRNGEFNRTFTSVPTDDVCRVIFWSSCPPNFQA